MGNENDDDRDYDEYRVKVPRYDKNGEDISGDRLGGGGRHRKDGTISGMAYDFEPVEESDRKELMKKVEAGVYKEQLQRQATIDNVFDIINSATSIVVGIAKWVEENPDKASRYISLAKEKIHVIKSFTEKGKKSISSWLNKISKKKDSAELVVDNPGTQISIEIPVDENASVKKMTKEELQAKYIEFLLAYITTVRCAKELENTQLVDGNQLISAMNVLVQEHPELLDEKVQSDVSTILSSLQNDEKDAILLKLNIPENKLDGCEW